MANSLSIVCSDEARNGKTLFARLLTDCLSLAGAESFRVFDTNFPKGSLAGYFPENSKILDFSRTQGQVVLFDTVLSEPQFDYVVDLQSHHLEAFFKVFSDIGFDAEANERQLAISVFYVLDRDIASVANGLKVSKNLRYSSFVPIRNEAMGNVLTLPVASQIYSEIHKSREIILPRLSVDALNQLDQLDFTFADFIAKNGMKLPVEMRIEIWNFLEAVYNQRQTNDDEGPVVF